MLRQAIVIAILNAISRGQLEHVTAIPAGYLGFSDDAPQLVASKHHPGEWSISSDNRCKGFFDWSETLLKGFGPLHMEGFKAARAFAKISS